MATRINTIRRRGATTVELAMVAPLLIFLLFGIIEFGLMVKNLVGINQAAREGARSASVGATPATLETRVRGAAPTINADDLSIACDFRSFDQSAGTWSAWQTLGVDGSENSAGRGDQIRVSIQYPHQLVTGGLFAGLADDPENGTITLSTAIVMQRE
ncbi:MAG: TadE/TadG family type IV pilus assembly protein [Armatimonadota bacterium]|jgi:Flp pilus assembly protein TadG